MSVVALQAAREPSWATTQPHLYKAVVSLTEHPKYRRNCFAPECAIESVGGAQKDKRRFSIRRAMSKLDISKAHALLSLHLKPEEMESEERLWHNADYVIMGDRPPACRGYRFFLAENEKGEVVATYAGNVMNLPGGRAVFIGHYAATRSDHQRLGLMRQLYISGLMQAAVDADELGEELVVTIGDSTPESEHMWNSVGRARLCISEAAGCRELYLNQPAVRFDRGTGLPTAGSRVVKQHLMVRAFGCEIAKDLVHAAAEAYYAFCGRRPAEDFSTVNGAYDIYRGHFSGLLLDFKTRLYGEGALVPILPEDRERLMDSGCWIE